MRFLLSGILFLALFFSFQAVSAQSTAPSNRTVQTTIPGTKVSYKMALLPGGMFTMGSPAAEAGRDEDEGRHTVALDSFWIGVWEVTWDEFDCFQFVKFDSDSAAAKETFRAAAVARPTPPYFDFVYGRGRAGGFPAASMTQQAALRYCQWLSDKTGDFYRLPTEAEWEYACRAGAKTTFMAWGDDPKQAADYAWFYDNSAGSYQKVGTKKPNAWGLYDLHGNVAEWTLDFYVTDYFSRLDSASVNPMIFPPKKHSRTVRGGSFEDSLYTEELRCADRRKSEAKWQARDPQIPKSKWWNPDSPFVGFRLVKETKPRTKAERDAFFEKAIKD